MHCINRLVISTYDSQFVICKLLESAYTAICAWYYSIASEDQSEVQVLYFGDHLYSDLRGPAKAGWRTAAIVRELEVCSIPL